MMLQFVKMEHEADPIIKTQNYFLQCKKEEASNNLPTQNQIKKQKIKKNKTVDEEFVIKRSKVKQIRWNKEEDFVYLEFMKENKSLFQSEYIRRTGKVFMRLALLMNGQRTPNQCKSHHQKMQKVTKTGCVEEVIAYLENKYSLAYSQSPQCNKINEEIKTSYSDEHEEHLKLYVCKFRNITEINVRINVESVAMW